MQSMQKYFSTYFEKLDKQNRRSHVLLMLGVFVLVIFLTIGFTLPTNNPLLRRFFMQDTSQATTSVIESDAETGTLTGNVTVGSDPAAAGGQYIQFGSTTTGTTGSGTTYYVDCDSGNDSNTGTSQTSAWLTVNKASSVALNPGDTLLLKRGCEFTGTLKLTRSGTETSMIHVAAYGTGDYPIIGTGVDNSSSVDISGSYNLVENIEAEAYAPAIETGCQNNPKGHVVGFTLETGATNNTIKNAKASGGYAGVYIKSGASNNHVLSNVLANNNMMSPLDTTANNDAGAFGVLLWGDNNEIAYNTISGSDACSYDYTRDGSAVEVYNGSFNNVHHNIATSSDAFTELGKDSSHSSSDNTYAYNTFISSNNQSIFLNTRGNTNYGPIYRTKAYNNSVYLTGASSQGVVCSSCASDILTLKNNILWANWKAIYASAAFDESNNIYWKTGGSPLVQGFTPSATSKKVDPQYVSTGTGDLHVLSSSPAVNAGVDVGYTADLDGHPVPQGSGPDIGAYEQ